MIHWNRKIVNVPGVFLRINHYHIWSIIIHFPISFYWFVPVNCTLPSSVFVTTLGAWLYHLFPEGIQCFLSNNQWMCLATISCWIRYFDLGNTVQPLLRCITVSLDSSHNLHIGDTSRPSRCCFIEFTRSAYPFAAHTVFSISFWKCLPINHCHVLSVFIFYASFRNLSWRGIYVYSFYSAIRPHIHHSLHVAVQYLDKFL